MIPAEMELPYLSSGYLKALIKRKTQAAEEIERQNLKRT